ncbi:hypothetical protein JV173_02960 [Acholeplasma equirhinis]|uniref:hypothetical protein n=1 Tax=Acholeplasma equirhinis TaxID=555393 RepID=UPI00197A9533|nr:hypothetical protein [Acholeplasma equirhinis]MBN3490469.1 hypothetical protein [Acholeplasma equirhinis]
MNKRLSITLLIVLVIAIIYTVSVSFSYWAALDHYANVYISIDTLHEAELSVNLKEDESNFNKKLVPQGFVKNSDEVDEIHFIFELDLTGDELLPGVELGLTITAINVLLDGTDQYNYLVVIELPNNGNLLISNEVLVVVVKVRLLEPATSEIATAIMGKNITFDLHFRVVS